MFIDPLSIDLHFDLIKLYFVNEMDINRKNTVCMDRGGWAALTVPIKANSEAQKWVAHV